MFFCWGKLDESQHLDLVFECRSWGSFLSPWQAVLIPKDCKYDFFQLLACLNFFFLGNIIWCHSFGCLPGFGFKWLDPGFSIPHDSQRLEAVTSSSILLLKISGNCFLSLCVHLSAFLAPTEHGPLNSQTLR